MDYDRFAPLIGAKIKEAAAIEGLKPEDIAARLDVSVAQVYKYYSGANITFEALFNIAVICRQPIGWFLAVDGLEDKVAEEMSPYHPDKKRRDLVIKVKRLIQTADDGAINALLSNVDEFQEKADLKKRLEEIEKR